MRLTDATFSLWLFTVTYVITMAPSTASNADKDLDTPRATQPRRLRVMDTVTAVQVPTYGRIWKAIDLGALQSITELPADQVLSRVLSPFKFITASSNCNVKGTAAPKKVATVAAAARSAAVEAAAAAAAAAAASTGAAAAAAAANGSAACKLEAMCVAAKAAMMVLLEHAQAGWGCAGDRQPTVIVEL